MAEQTAVRLLMAQGITLANDGLLQLFPEGYRWIDSLADIPRQTPSELSAHGLVLVLAPEQARELLRRPPSAKFVVVLWLTTQNFPPHTLLHNPRVAGVLDPACSPATVYAVLRSALALANRQLALTPEQMLQEVLKVGRALASEKDLNALLKLILTHARSLTSADGASIYTMNDRGELCFRVWQNSSATHDVEAESVVGAESIAGHVACTGEILAIADAYAIANNVPYRFNRSYDDSSGYRTRSVLTIPLKNKSDAVIGVLQLINRKARADAQLGSAAEVAQEVIAFNEQDKTIAAALAGQAGVALENNLLYREIENLLSGFIAASVRAIESRDPITAGHSFRVADFSERLAQAVDRSDHPILRAVRFDATGLRELRYAALLHDFGKVGVREDVLLKSKKLYPLQLELIRQRFKYVRMQLQRDMYRRLLDEHGATGVSPQQRAAAEAALEQEFVRIERFWDSLACANEPNVMPLAVSADLKDVASYQYWDEDEKVQRPLLTRFEFADLSLARGNLSTDERILMEAHVTHTYAFLSAIPWTVDLANLPEIAFAHHEKLDGTGYPRRLLAEQIPLPAKIMAIADIFDALTAGDRPYKSAVSIDKALDILREEAGRAKIDKNLVQVFVESKAYSAKDFQAG